jgi:hypothetical protein
LRHARYYGVESKTFEKGHRFFRQRCRNWLRALTSVQFDALLVADQLPVQCGNTSSDSNGWLKLLFPVMIVLETSIGMAILDQCMNIFDLF